MTRISWEDYFMQTAQLASVRSPCERLKVGCVLVKNNRLISMGYNGFLGGCEHKSIVRDGHEQATIHAEINAITDAAKRVPPSMIVWRLCDPLPMSQLLQGSSE